MKYDITGRITQHSMKRIDTLRKRMAVRIPSGPLRAQPRISPSIAKHGPAGQTAAA